MESLETRAWSAGWEAGVQDALTVVRGRLASMEAAFVPGPALATMDHVVKLLERLLASRGAA